MNLHTLPPPSSPLPPTPSPPPPTTTALPPTPPTATISTPTPTGTKVTRISGEQEQKIIPLKEYKTLLKKTHKSDFSYDLYSIHNYV